MATIVNVGVAKVVHTKSRGWRLGLGPSFARFWYGRGGYQGFSTGESFGPAWLGHYFPAKKRGRR